MRCASLFALILLFGMACGEKHSEPVKAVVLIDAAPTDAETVEDAAPVADAAPIVNAVPLDAAPVAVDAREPTKRSDRQTETPHRSADFDAKLGEALRRMQVNRPGQPSQGTGVTVGVGVGVLPPPRPSRPALPPKREKRVLLIIEDPTGSLGGLSAKQISKVVHTRKRKFQACYQRELARDPALVGRVDFKLNIDNQGDAQRVRVKSTTLRNDRVQSCVTHSLSSARFPKPKTPATVGVRIQFRNDREKAKPRKPTPVPLKPGTKYNKVSIVKVNGNLAGRTPEQIRRVLERQLRTFKACYERRLQRTPGIGGVVSFRMRIDVGGVASRARTRTSTLNNDAVEACVIRTLNQGRYPKHTSMARHVQIRMHFQTGL